MAADTPYRLFGIRHHGPGSARSLVAALEAYAPDTILIEGPPEADALIAVVAQSDLVPPVALLVHATDTPQHAVFYPFAEFSPEWQALRYALANKVDARFFDLPQAHALAVEEMEKAAAPDLPDVEPDERTDDTQVDESTDALSESAPDDSDRAWRDLARAAGFDDPEVLWERLVEQRQNHAELFAAVAELMAALRESTPTPKRDQLREAWMRRALRAEIKAGRQRIAVVCGAMHVPALQTLGPAKTDNDILRGLPKIKTSATWVPWTHDRLAFESGYGAGVTSPGWYAHLWSVRSAVIESWMSRAARIFRDDGLDIGPAHAIEGTRLAHAMAALRGRSTPHLSDVIDAIETVFCNGDPRPLALVRSRLVIGEVLGQVPADMPRAPLAADLAREQKRLRLAPEASQRTLELDLRKDHDLQRSVLLHRLDLLGIAWGRRQTKEQGKGTFRETWELRWDPGFEVRLIALSRYGNRLADAATAYLIETAATVDNLGALAAQLDRALLAQLPDAVAPLAQRLDDLAAQSADVVALMGALARLIGLLRYRDVRRTEAAPVAHMVHNYLERVCVGLPLAGSNLQDEAAEIVCKCLDDVDQAMRLVDAQEQIDDWVGALDRLASAGAAHPRCAGRANRLLQDRAALAPDELERRLSRALSPAVAAAQAAWLEGFLGESGLILVHRPELLALIDAWVVSLSLATFQELLPLLRRAFARFASPERRQIGDHIKGSEGVVAVASSPAAADIDWPRALPVLDNVRHLFGLAEAAS